jgi:hypothetical protein
MYDTKRPAFILGGMTVLMGVALFAANRINVNIALEFWSGRSILGNNYVTWLMSTSTGFGILFAIVVPYLTKGKGEHLLPDSQACISQEALDVGIHRELVRVRPHRKLDVLFFFVLCYPVYRLTVKYRL